MLLVTGSAALSSGAGRLLLETGGTGTSSGNDSTDGTSFSPSLAEDDGAARVVAVSSVPVLSSASRLDGC